MQENVTEKQKRKATRSPSSDLESELTESVPDGNAINPVQCRPPENREAQVRRHKHVETTTHVTETNWQDEVKISDDYAKYCIKYIIMLLVLGSMWDGHLDRIYAARHWT